MNYCYTEPLTEFEAGLFVSPMQLSYFSLLSASCRLDGYNFNHYLQLHTDIYNADMNTKGLSSIEFVAFLSKFPLDLWIVHAFYFGFIS